MSSRNVLVVLGTRPEAIKLAPVVRALQATPQLEPVVISTGQHREMLDQMLVQLEISPVEDLRVMRERQSLPTLTATLIEKMSDVVRRHRPAAVVVQGDTTTAFAGGLAAFYEQVPIAHVEAGLRSGSLVNPFPEEANRQLLSRLATWHFAPTQTAGNNLTRENPPSAQIHVTGNTSIDNLLWARTTSRGHSAFTGDGRRKVLVTLHRRENQGSTMQGIAEAIARIARRGDVEIVLPLHKSPAVREALVPILSGLSAVRLVEPLDYFEFTATMAASELVVTDSGGVQEEAPSLGKPVLVVRENTERPEAVEAGVARLIGVSGEAVHRHVCELLDDERAYASMARAVNPFGDGHAAARIADVLATSLAQPLPRVSAA